MSGCRRCGRRSLGVLVLALVGLEACGQRSSLPASPPSLDVEMFEYGFRYSRPVPRGRVVFDVRNGGKLNHELLLVVLPDDFPMTIQEQIRSKVRQAFPTRAQVLDVSPGGIGKFAVDLERGRYAFLCFLADPDGQRHANKGMSSEFKVT